MPTEKDFPAIRCLLVVLGLSLIQSAYQFFLLPSQLENRYFLGLYSGPKFTAILACIIAGVTLALAARHILAAIPTSWKGGLRSLDLMLIQFVRMATHIRPVRLFISLSLIIGIIGLFVHPYILGDLAFQLWSTHLHDLGFTNKLNVIPIPDPADLSQHTEKHIVLYPLGIPWLVGCLMKTGLGMSSVVYLLGFTCFLSGGVGCLKILHALRFPPAVKVVMAVILTTVCFSRRGLSFLTIGGCDVFCFGLLPWGIYFALTAFHEDNVNEKCQIPLLPRRALVAALMLGSVYLLKYSQFTFACATAFFLSISCFLSAVRHHNKIAGLFATAVLSIISLMPFAALTNHQRDNGQGDAIAYTERGGLGKSPLILRRYGKFYEESSSGLPLLATLPAAPGWLFLSSGGTLSSLVVWCQGFTSIDDWIEDNLKTNGNVVLSAALGFLCSWLIFKCGKDHFRQAPFSHKFFLLSLAIIPPLLLAHTSFVKGYNYLLSHENRFGIPAFVIVEALLLGCVWQKLIKGSFPIFLKLSVLAFFLHPFLSQYHHLLGHFAKHDKFSHRFAQDAILAPRLSQTDSRKLVETIRRLATNKQDIIVFAGDKAKDGGLLYGSSQLALNFPNRCLLFDDPTLGAPRFAQTNPDSFTTSRELRVIILLHKSHCRDSPKRMGILEKWRARFPQANGKINSLPKNNAWNFSVHWLDLSVTPSKSNAPLSS